MYWADIRVGFKKGVTDPEGANTAKALKLLGFEEVEQVKFSKFYSVKLNVDSEERARELAERMCEKLLSNPVINYYEITVREAKEEVP